MALNVNGYSQDFQKFVDFASGPVKGGAIANMDGTRHTVSKSSSDGVGGFYSLFRSQGNKNANDVTRILFKQSVAEIFGGEDKIPDSVKTAMKMDDFGQGKPLTARRIMAVKSAVDQFNAAFDTAKTNARDAFTKAGPAGKDQLEASIHDMVDRCKGDPELLSLVSRYSGQILLAGDNTLRSDAAIRQKVDGLRANLQEIRELSKSNPALKQAGLEFLDSLHGKSVPQGLIGKLVNAAKAVPIKDVTSLSGSSSAVDINKAIRQFDRSVNSVIDDTGASRALDGGDELLPTRNLVETLVVSRFSKGERKGIQTALSTPTASKLQSLYQDVMVGRIKARNASPAVAQVVVEQGASFSVFMNHLKTAVDIASGIPASQVDGVDGYRGAFNRADIDGDAILLDFAAAAREKLAKEKEAFINQTVQGTGQGVKALRGIFARKLTGEINNPHIKLQEDMAPIALAYFNQALAVDCRRNAAEDWAESTFAKDLPRGFVFKVGDTQLSTDLRTARDQVAQFVSKNPNATYDGLDQAMKTKTNLIMAMFSQETTKAAEKGVAKGLDPALAEDQFMMGTVYGTGSHTFTVRFTTDNKLFLDYEGTRETSGIVYPDGSYSRLGADSTVQYKMHLEIPADEFDRMASLDYSRVDDAEWDRLEYKGAPASTGQPAASTGSVAPQADSVFRLDPSKVSCQVHFSANIN